MKKLIIIVFAGLMFTACETQRKVTRLSDDQNMELSGRWNDADSKMVADAIIEQLLGGKWLENYKAEGTKKHVVVVGKTRNKSHEHIDTQMFTKNIEKAIINGGEITLVQGGEKRDDVRLEKVDQGDAASTETAKQWGQEIGADLILQGSINSIVDTYKSKKVVKYSISFQLTNIETNEVIWAGDKDIKKFIEN